MAKKATKKVVVDPPVVDKPVVDKPVRPNQTMGEKGEAAMESRKAAFYAAKAPELAARKEMLNKLHAQLTAKGLDVGKMRDPHVLTTIGHLVLPNKEGGKPFVTFGKKERKKMGFRKLVGKILRGVKGVLTGGVYGGTPKGAPSSPMKEVKRGVGSTFVNDKNYGKPSTNKS